MSPLRILFFIVFHRTLLAQCDLNCNPISCSIGSGICSDCNPPYTLLSNVCELCSSISNCLNCQTANYKCTFCDPNINFYLNIAGTCSPCSDKPLCKTCDPSASMCSECLSDFYVKTSMYLDCIECSALYPYCKQCINNAGNVECTSCISDLYGGYFCELCMYSKPNCLRCNQYNCTECTSTAYYLDYSGNCYDCSTISSCNLCDPTAQRCAVCADNFQVALDGTCEPCSNYVSVFYDSSSKSCKKCDPTCNTCEGWTIYNCLTCMPNDYLVVSKKQCVSTCPSNTLADSSTKRCLDCDPSCLTCSISQSNCTSCDLSLVLQSGTCTGSCFSPYFSVLKNGGFVCVSPCPDGYYPEQATRKCQICDGSCKLCSGPGSLNCSSCNSSFFLTVSRSCVACDVSCRECSAKSNNCTQCSPFYNPLWTSNIGFGECVYLCDSGCQTCNGDYVCSICKPDFYLKMYSETSQALCNPKTIISAQLKSIKNPQVFLLTFSAKWDHLFKNLSSLLLIKVSDLKSSDFNCTLREDNTVPNSFSIFCQYYQTIINQEHELSLEFVNIPKEDQSSEVVMRNLRYTQRLESFYVCQENFIWNKDLGYCEAGTKRRVQPSLRLTNDPLRIHLVFNDEIPTSMDLAIDYFIKPSFPNNPELLANFSFKINKLRSRTFELELAFLVQIKNNPLFAIELLLSADVLADFTLEFSATKAEIHLMDYYFLQEEVKQQVVEAGKATSSGSTGVIQSFSVSNAFTPGKAFAMKGMVLIQVVQLFRFINIKYPPNVLELFSGELVSYAGKFKIREKSSDGLLEGPYYQYQLSIYVINNCGSFIIAGWAFNILGWIVNFMGPLAVSKFKNKVVVQKLVGFIDQTFVWNYGITHFLSQYQTLLFVVGLGFKFPTLNSEIGRFNFVFTIFGNIFLYLIPVFATLILRRMRVIQAQTENITAEDHAYMAVGSDHGFSEKSLTNTTSGAQTKYDISKPDMEVIPKPFKKMSQDISDKSGEISPLSDHDRTGLTHPILETKSEANRRSLPESPEGLLKNYSMEKDMHLEEISNEDNKKSMGTFFKEKTEASEVQLASNTESKASTKYDLISPTDNKAKSADQNKPIEAPGENEHLKKMKSHYKAFHEDFKNTNHLSYYFLILELCRQIVTTLFLFEGDINPMASSIGITVLNGTFLLLLLFVRPFKEMKTFLLTFITECLLFTSSLGISLLAVMDDEGVVDFDKKMKTGWLVVYSNLLTVYIVLFFQAYSYLELLIKILKKVRDKVKNKLKRSAPINPI